MKITYRIVRASDGKKLLESSSVQTVLRMQELEKIYGVETKVEEITCIN